MALVYDLKPITIGGPTFVGVTSPSLIQLAPVFPVIGQPETTATHAEEPCTWLLSELVTLFWNTTCEWIHRRSRLPSFAVAYLATTRNLPCIVLLAFVASALPPAIAQSGQSTYTPDVQNIGLPANGVFSGGQIDSVQLSSGNLHVDIPLLRLPGIGMDTDIHFTYDNQVFNVIQVPGFPPGTNAGDATWNLITMNRQLGQVSDPLSGFLKYAYHTMDWECGGGVYAFPTHATYLDYVSFSDRDATSHAFPVSGYESGQSLNVPQCDAYTPLPTSSYSGDASGYNLQLTLAGLSQVGSPVMVRDKHGNKYSVVGGGGSAGVQTQLYNSAIPANPVIGPTMISYSPVTSIEDANGNVISGAIAGNVWAITDTANRKITETLATAGQIPYMTYEALGNQVTSIQYFDQNNQSQTIHIQYSAITLNLASLCGGSQCGVSVGTNIGAVQAQLPTALILQNGDKYTLAYVPNDLGELSSITLPTGAVISYVWGPNLGHGPAVQSRTVTSNGQASTWQFGSVSNGNRTSTLKVTDPFRNDTVSTCSSAPVPGGNYPGGTTCWVTNEAMYNGSAASQQPIATRIIGYQAVSAFAGGPTTALPSSNVFTWNATGATTETDITYDNNFYAANSSWHFTRGNPLSKAVYDYGTGSHGGLLNFTQYTYLHDQNTAYAAANIADRIAQVSVYNSMTPSASTLVAQTSTSYDQFNQGGQGGLGSTSGTSQHDYVNYSVVANALRGLPTGTTKYVGANLPSITTYVGYNDLGQMINSFDSGGNETAYLYGSQNAFLASTLLPTTNGVQHLLQTSYDINTGLLIWQKDLNGNKTAYTYDSLMRPLSVQRPDTGATTTSYPTPVQVITTVSKDSSHNLVTTVNTDGLGRPIHVLRPDGSQTDTVYDLLGRLHSVTNPYYSNSDSTYAFTTFAYDPLGRKSLQINPDNSQQQLTYTGSIVDSWDEVGVHTQHTFDALGRLQLVGELGNAANPLLFSTGYSYDAVGNLRNVNQLGGTGDTPRSRNFTYDSLSRLLTANNPETGTLSYSYFRNGLPCSGDISAPCSKLDANGKTTSYYYDALNRLNNKFYSDGTYPSSFSYDGYRWDGSLVSQIGFPSQNVIGRLTSEENRANFGVVYSYDVMGRVSVQNQFHPFDGLGWGGKTVTAKYDLAGNLTDLTYPDGHHVVQVFDSTGRLANSGLSDINGTISSQSYLQSVSYFPDGSTSQTVLGNGVVQSVTKNNRLQVQSMSAWNPFAPFNNQTFLSHVYCYVNCATGGSFDNGNIWGITDTINSNRTQGFTYDGLNRLTGFSLPNTNTNGVISQNNGNQTYWMDSFGNMSPTSGRVHLPIYSFDPATNRIANLPCASMGGAYDAAGNQLCSTDMNGAITQFVYDAENRIKTINALNGSPSTTYTYGADGMRGAKVNADGTLTAYITFGGQTIAEKDQTGAWTDYIFANGKKIAMVPQVDIRFHLHGNNPAADNSLWVGGLVPVPAGIVIQQGDELNYRIYQHNAFPYINLDFSDGSNADWYLTGQNHANTQDGIWTNMSYSLNGPMVGKQLIRFEAGDDRGPSGAFDVMLADVAINHADGTVTQFPVSGTAGYWGYSTQMGANFVTETVNTGIGPQPQTRFYLSDHLGTAQMELSSGGWPVWQGQFAPYGGELRNGIPVAPDMPDTTTANRYKFTGKERDAESGLDYFGARYYASPMGRFMSPDWAAKAQPVPYAKLDNPQSLNLYSYVLNNPLSKTDPDGHCIEDACILEGAAVIAALESPAGQRLEEEAEEAAERFSGPIEAGLSRASSWAGAQLAKAGRALEEQAEKFSGQAKDGRILEGQATGAKYRVPDLLVRVGKEIKAIGEVKDTAKLGTSKQLTDLMGAAKDSGAKFSLYLGEKTQLSKPLIEQLKQSGATVYRAVGDKFTDITKTLK